jgi:hypothetical protein
MSDFMNVQALRAESDLDDLMASTVSSSVQTRWERKSIKAGSAASASASADRFIPSRYAH